MGKVLMGFVLLVALYLGAGAMVVAAAGPFAPSGAMVDMGGRKIRLVCAGAKSERPTVWMEAGAFGIAADFSAIQEKLAAKGIRSCAYDRAGLGWSDPGSKPRDAAAIVADLETLTTVSGERGPFILMGHSMAGLHVRMFAARNPEKVAGLVLIEATTPEQADNPGTMRFLQTFVQISRVAAVVNTLGLARPFLSKGDKIGLPPQGSAEKRRAFVSGRNARTASDEIVNWGKSAAQAKAAGPLDPAWPVAVIVARERFGSAWTAARKVPMEQSRAGLYITEPRASHNSILGRTYGETAVRGVEHVLANMAPVRL